MKLPLHILTYNSPFKRLKLRWYFGKITKGVPYFLPRKWVKYTKEDMMKNAIESMNNPQLVKSSMDEWLDYYKSFSKAVRIKFGFSYCNLGWKTKWNSDDYRFEYSPVYSFVAFGYQITLTFVAEHDSAYWESFLAYHYETDKKLSRELRIKDCIKRYPQKWVSDGKKIDYWKLILK